MTEVQAFLLTLFAGLSTGIGGLFAFHKKASGRTFLTASLGFSAGVMIYVSFVEILPKAIRSLEETQFAENGYLVGTLAFFAGILVIALIDFLVPKQENPHEFPDETETDGDIRSSLFRMGIFSALAIGIHNFPEGLATFIAALESPTLGISIGIAIPIYQATGSRKKAFLYALLSGLSEPVGALIGGFLLIWLLNDLAFGLTFAFVAGIMVYISVDELLPTAERYGKHHISIIGLVGGMAVMAMSLILFS
jgi:zinc transporter, ZIP family